MEDQEMFPDDMTLGEAREKLRGLVEDGHACPVCTQLAKVYNRPIHATMARELIAFYRLAGTGWGDPPQTAKLRGGDFAKLRYWGLIEAADGKRDDGSSRNGVWRVTANGERWVLGQATVASHARCYASRFLSFEGEQIGVRDALGKNFSYDELMHGQMRLDGGETA